MHDICHAFDACPAPPSEPVRHALTLRKWIALKPERELRCFVRQRDLIGLCTPVLEVSFFVNLLLLLAGKPAAAEASPASLCRRGELCCTIAAEEWTHNIENSLMHMHQLHGIESTGCLY